MKSPADGRVEWHFYRVRLAGSELAWNIHLYSEFHYEITAIVSQSP
jgi:hypothetical protein